MTEHHPLRRLAEALDHWDDATESFKQAAHRLEQDLESGVHDALFDDAAMVREVHPAGTEAHVMQQEDDITTE